MYYAGDVCMKGVSEMTPYSLNGTLIWTRALEKGSVQYGEAFLMQACCTCPDNTIPSAVETWLASSVRGTTGSPTTVHVWAPGMWSQQLSTTLTW